jgi:hypothetical protein
MNHTFRLEMHARTLRATFFSPHVRTVVRLDAFFRGVAYLRNDYFTLSRLTLAEGVRKGDGRVHLN